MLAYNLTTNACDEYFKMKKLTRMEALKRFCKIAKECFETKLFWQPNKAHLYK
jgi:hypothetical protein